MKRTSSRGLLQSPQRRASPIAVMPPDARAVPTLAEAEALWRDGAWNDLARLTPSDLNAHSERHQLALLSACAQLQLDRREPAAEGVHQALAWGCEPRKVAQMLVAGLHNTMANICAVIGDNTARDGHFRNALLPARDADIALASHRRAVREMARLGLLPEAARLIEAETSAFGAASVRPLELAARVQTLRHEIQLLQDELALAHQRNQLAPPVPRRTDTDASKQSVDLDALKQRSPSQLGQDLWVLERSGYKRGGFFVEFGATDGIVLSNSFLLEREFGWHGICAEPNPAMFEKLKRNRKCIVSDACIGAVTGSQVNFIIADVYGGIERFAFEDSHAEKREAYRSAGEVMQMSTISLDDLLTKLGAPQQIDYLSIDTEGSEFEILAPLSFDKWSIRLITVEHNFTDKREAIRALLEGYGYRRTERDFDDFYERVS